MLCAYGEGDVAVATDGRRVGAVGVSSVFESFVINESRKGGRKRTGRVSG